MHQVAGPQPSRYEVRALVLRSAILITRIIRWRVLQGGMSIQHVEGSATSYRWKRFDLLTQWHSLMPSVTRFSPQNSDSTCT